MSRDIAVPQGQGGRSIPWRSLKELVDFAAQRAPEKEVLRDDDGNSLTFDGLASAVSRVASSLLSHGLRPGDRVAVMADNTLDWPVTWLGIIEAGGVAVPVNKAYRSTDLAFVLKDSAAAFVIVDENAWQVVETVLEECTAVRLVLEIGSAETDAASIRWAGDREPVLDDDVWDGVANLQYTSGTTGFPKACVLSEQYWLRAGWLTAEAAELGRDDVVLTTQPYSYIDPQWHTVMCLVAGATLVVLPRFSARRYWEAIREHRVTFAYVLGTMPVILFKQEPSSLDRAHDVRLMLCSAIPTHLHQAFEDRWGTPWREAYGTTETGIDLVVPAEAVGSVGSGIAGRVVATKKARIVDPDGQDVASGETGELVLRGEPMMSRYHNRPAETKAAFRDGWLRTGDLARQDSDGWIRIVGRLKDMVRRAGENIAAAEVESVLAAHPDVAMSAVIPVLDPVTEEEVKAFVLLRQPDKDRTDVARSIIEHAQNNLAKFKVPRFIEFVESFELTPSERVIKSALVRDDQRTGSFDANEDAWLK